MDPINPWIDSAAVRKLAEQLLRPVEASHFTRSDQGFDDSFQGFTIPEPFTLHHLDDIIPISLTDEASAEESHRAASLSKILSLSSASGLFFLDESGNELTSPNYQVRFRRIAEICMGDPRFCDNIRIRVSASELLEIIPCDTPNGRKVIGIIVPKPIEPSHIDEIRAIVSVNRPSA